MSRMSRMLKELLSGNIRPVYACHHTVCMMPVADDSFGYKYLKKKGWKTGKGLGKNQQGEASAIKVNLKGDRAGVGHDLSEQFTNQWWNHVFNKAAAKVSVEAADGVVKVKSQQLSEDKKAKLKEKTLYGNFVKGSTLVGGAEEKEEDNSDTDSEDSHSKLPDFTKLTDEQLFEACGGRTAHKGARHGLKLNGKLSRLEEQEGKQAEKESVKTKSKKSKKRKGDKYDKPEKNKKPKKSSEPADLTSSDPITSERQVKSQKSKKKKKLKGDIKSGKLGKTLDHSADSASNVSTAKRKKKRRKQPQTADS